MPTNFLEALGTSGFITTPFNLLSTELNSLATANGTTSSVGGASGIFTLSSFTQAIYCEVYFQSGGSWTPAAPSYLAGWFLFSPDGGTTFETTVSNTDLTRTPDFMIPLNTSAYANTNIAQANGLVRVPWWSNKVFLVSHAGATMPASGNLIKAAPVAIQY